MSAVEAIKSRLVLPDPSITDAVGRHHTLGTAVADLVDNSIDAGAEQVLVRFVLREGRAVGLRVLDDGRGMDAAQINEAMTFAHKRAYGTDDLGHFGLGLKAASLSQADEFDVYTRAVGGAHSGRRTEAGEKSRVHTLDPAQVAGEMRKPCGRHPERNGATGTIVEWRRVRSFLSSGSASEQRAWLERTVQELLALLGVVFHRIIEAGRAEILVDVFDTDSGEAGVPRRVGRLDPFDYADPGGYGPVELRGLLDGEGFVLRAHVWPHRQSASSRFRLFGRDGGDFQGFHVYRRDRLLQIGGWNGVLQESPERRFLRIEVELEGPLLRHATINPEKSGVEFDAALCAAVERCTDGRGLGLPGLLDRGRGEWSASKRRSRREVTLVEPDRGFSPGLLGEFGELAKFSDHAPIDVRWGRVESGGLFDVDLGGRTLWLDERQRSWLSRDDGEAADAPLVKTLLWLLCSRFFEGSRLGVRERRELDTWKALLAAALEEDRERRACAEGVESG